MKNYGKPSRTGWELGARDLRLIAAIHEAGSLTTASVRFHLTPSALSHQLRQLERRCGLQLFNRVGTRLSINAAGRLLLETAETVLPALEAARGSIERMTRRGPETLSISTECYTCYHWLPRALPKLRSELGEIDFRIRADITRRPVEAVIEGALDLGIVSQEISDTPGLVSEEVFEDEMVVLVSANHPLARRPYMRPSDFRSVNALVYSADPAVSALLGDVLATTGVEPAAVIEVPLTEAIIELVRAEEGVALFANWAVLPVLQYSSLVALRMGRRGVFRQWRVVCAANSPVVRLLPTIAGVLAEEMGNIDPVGS